MFISGHDSLPSFSSTTMISNLFNINIIDVNVCYYLIEVLNQIKSTGVRFSSSTLAIVDPQNFMGDV